MRCIVAAAGVTAAFALAAPHDRATPPPPGRTATAVPVQPDVTGAAAQPSEASPAAAPAQANSTPGSVVWSELRYSARKLIFAASAVLSVQRVSADELAALVRRPPRALPVPLPAGDAVAVSMATDLPFGRRERVVVWLDPATGAALGGEETTLGYHPYRKSLRFTEDGLYTWRSAPRDSREANLAPEGWTQRKQYLVSPAVKPPPGTAVTDSFGLLYLVSAARLDRKDSSLRLVMLADDGYVELVFTPGGLSYRRAGFEESWTGGSKRREGPVLVRTVRATGHALGAPDPRQGVDLGFLGMRGALTLDVEVGTGIPIAFAGRAEHIGDLTVRLECAVLNGPPPAGSDPTP